MATIANTRSKKNFDEICKSYIKSKQLQIIKKYKLIIPTNKKFEKIYINL